MAANLLSGDALVAVEGGGVDGAALHLEQTRRRESIGASCRHISHIRRTGSDSVGLNEWMWSPRPPAAAVVSMVRA